MLIALTLSVSFALVPQTADPDVVSPVGLTVDLGEGRLPLLIPADEQLEFGVIVDLGIFGEPQAGTVQLDSGVEKVLVGLPAPGQESPVDTIDVGWIRAHATGSALGFRLDHVLEVRILPQEWPHFDYRDEQKGSDHRRRVLKIGTRDGRSQAYYRRDRHCKGCKNPEHYNKARFIWEKDGHCGGCKRAPHRVWANPKERDVPPGTVDLLSAVFLARSMLRDGTDEYTFHLIDRDELWLVTFQRGRRRKIETLAGDFDAVQIKLLPQRAPGDEEEEEQFEGLFGIHGTIDIWVEASTGVPVLIAGSIPAGFLTFDVRIELKSFQGTPSGFAPL